MKYEDLSFTIKDKDGQDVVCDIVSVVPNEENEDEPYVVFTDYMLDENDEFIMQYGKIVEENGNFALKTIEDQNIIDKIKELLADDVVSYVNNQIEENISD